MSAFQILLPRLTTGWKSTSVFYNLNAEILSYREQHVLLTITAPHALLLIRLDDKTLYSPFS